MAKSINWRNGGTIEIKVGDTNKTSDDFDTLDALKEQMKLFVDQHACQECGGALKGKYFVNFTKCRLYDSEQAKGMFGGSKTKYVLRETVWRVNSWGVEKAKCKGCKKTFLSTRMIEREEAREEARQKREERQENYGMYGMPGDKAVCPDCDNVLGTGVKYAHPCPRCGYAGRPKFKDPLFGL